VPLGVLGGDAGGWLDVPVWVDLDQLYGPAPDGVEPWPGGHLVHGLVLTGKAPGRLRQWGRAVDGRWVGLVDFTVCDLHGARGRPGRRGSSGGGPSPEPFHTVGTRVIDQEHHEEKDRREQGCTRTS